MQVAAGWREATWSSPTSLIQVSAWGHVISHNIRHEPVQLCHIIQIMSDVYHVTVPALVMWLAAVCDISWLLCITCTSWLASIMKGLCMIVCDPILSYAKIIQDTCKIIIFTWVSTVPIISSVSCDVMWLLYSVHTILCMQGVSVVGYFLFWCCWGQCWSPSYWASQHSEVRPHPPGDWSCD